MTERLLVSPGASAQMLKTGEKNYLRLAKGDQYRVVHQGAKEVTRKEPVEAVREGQDLTVRYPDGTEVIVPDYYETCADGSCSLALGDGTAVGHVLNPEEMAVWAGPVVMYVLAAPAAPAPTSPLTASAPAPGQPAVTPTPLPVGTPAAAEGGWGVWKWIGLGGLAAAAAGGGGGGGGSDGDAVAPTLTGSSPADNASAVLVGSNIVLTFSEPVVAGSGNIVISNGTDTRTIGVTNTSQVTFSGNTVTINPATNLQGNSHYSVQFGSGVLRDVAGNSFAGIAAGGVLDFDTQDITAPTLSSSTPADNASAVLVGSDIVLTFSEVVVAGSGNIVISNGTDTRTIGVEDASQVTISGNTVTINPTTNLQGNSHYNVQFGSGVLRDVAGNDFAGIAVNNALDFDTQDLVAPMLSSSSPADNATAVLVGSNIVLTFSEAVVAGVGSISISNGTDTRTIDVTDTAQVTISGNTVTINPTMDLQSDSRYSVQIVSGVLNDAAGNNFAGISDGTVLDFDTQDFSAPTLNGSTPADNATEVPVGSNIVLTFSEAVVAGDGHIFISNGTDTRTINVTDTSQVTISGNTVTINPAADFQGHGHYHVQMDSGVIEDIAGNSFAGITASDTLDFETQNIVAPVNLADIAAGSGGFGINRGGMGRDSWPGNSVSSAGDVNGDGLSDLIGGSNFSGYVVFGKVDVAAANSGFGINGQAAFEFSGYSVSSAGDVNGDGLSDLIVGSYSSSYVVFGKTGGADVDLWNVDATGSGFVINGQVASDFSGYSVSSAGDVNGDGLTDLIVGVPYIDVDGAGSSYVVYGKTSSTAIDLAVIAAGNGGFVINGYGLNDRGGYSVSSAGDVNGDGLADLIVGAYGSDPVAGTDAGRSYVVFGKTGSSAVDITAVTAGDGGFVINGQVASDSSGYSVSSAGDVNGDGLADLIVGAHSSDPISGGDAGRSYVVFGKTGSVAVELSVVAAGNGGFVINGQESGDFSGNSVSSAGDINGDGLADLIVGVKHDYSDVGIYIGSSYVVYGKSSGSAVDLSAVAAGSDGFAINGQDGNEFEHWYGYSVSSAGDVNGDGLSDLIVGAVLISEPYGHSEGRSFVIFGGTSGAFAQTAVDQYGSAVADSFSDGGTAKTLVTGLGDDTLTATAASVLYGGAGNDLFNIDTTMTTALQSAFGSGGNIAQLARIDGGTGIDTLSLSGSGLTLDLTQIANQAASNPDGGSRIDSIEKVDLTGSGNNSLILQLRDVLDMGSANTFVTTGRQQLLVTGNSGDTVDFADSTGTTNWTQSGTQSISAVTYNVWNHNTSLATVYVHQALTVI